MTTQNITTLAGHRIMVDVLRRSDNCHRPLMAVAALMLICTIISIGGVLLDPQQILGAVAWLKPLKFALSI